MHARVLSIAALAISLAATHTSLGAQAVLGVGEDALTVPKGTVRFGVGAEWTQFEQIYTRDGSGGWTTRPAGSRLSADALGATHIPALSPLQTSLRTLTGLPQLSLSLGRLSTTATNRVQVTPLFAEVGLTRWLSVAVTVPIVQTRSSIFARANPNGTESDVAFLGDQASLNADTAFANQVVRAGTAVQAYCAGAGAATSACTGGTAFGASAVAFGNAVASVYGDVTNLVPLNVGTVQTAINAQAATIRATLNTFAGIGGSGVPQVTATGITGAAVPLVTGDVQQLFVDPRYGILADSLTTVERVGIGDVEVAAKVLLWDSFRRAPNQRFTPSGVNMRFAVGAGYRAPTGSVDSPDNFADIPTGTREAGVSGRGHFDVLVGNRFWTSIVGKFTRSMGSDVDVRVTDTPDQTLPGAYRRTTVRRELGNLLELDVTPRWVINELVSVAAQYQFRRQADTRYTGTSFTAGPDETTGDATLTIDPTTLGIESGFRDQRIGGGITFSNLKAYTEGRGSIPFEVSYQHSQTISGRGIYVPKASTDQLRIRLYWGLDRAR